MPTIQADRFKRKDKVVAAVAMPGIPEGTPGKVAMVTGFDWVRYWVRFDNGVSRGSLNRTKLARASEWEELKRRRDAGEDDHHHAGDTAAAGAADAGGGGSEGSGEGYLHNGVLIPQHLLDRSKKRREILGA